MPKRVRVPLLTSARMPTAEVGVGTGTDETYRRAGSISRGDTTASDMRADSRNPP
ncbi:hypothetical protein NS506_06887 [Nocardia seriolae]|uniref:Uncharacterized protein n=1 Tax=Nocardia seriolae TaxID=37332 RepID=A0ABC8B4M1_9NOCA|nr:hypothetical protein NS506_06887 [Nocardia seriolae]